MSKTQRTVTVGLWGLMVVSLLGLVAMMHAEARQSADANAPATQASQPLDPATVFPLAADPVALNKPSPTFKLIDQTGHSFDSAALRGKVWTASFFFSKCQGVCPGMMGRIHELEKAIPDPNVHNVYFTVDPARDTPERLAEYATEAKADATHWHMLTGDDVEMKRIAAAFGKPYEFPAQHSAAIVLVDRSGKITGYYESREPSEMLRLADDIRRLIADVPQGKRDSKHDAGKQVASR